MRYAMTRSLAGARKAFREKTPKSARRTLAGFEKKIHSAFGTAPRFLIIGCPRSGTTYAAESLLANGVLCGHESFFTPDGYRPNALYEGDSSWLAPVQLHHVDMSGVPIIHQIRHPLEVISSFLGISLFPTDPSIAERRFVGEHFEESGDPRRDAIRFYLEWNERCRVLASMTYRVEDFMPRFDEIVERLGQAPRTEERQALSTRVNTRRRLKIGWEDLPDGSEKRQLAEFMDRWDYARDPELA